MEIEGDRMNSEPDKHNIDKIKMQLFSIYITIYKLFDIANNLKFAERRKM